HIPHLPRREDILKEACTMFSGTPSLQEIVDRAYALFAASVGSRLVTIGDGAAERSFGIRKRKTPADDRADARRASRRLRRL
ncbi:MAG TPA: hypothetical protein VLA17_07155, partial [Candidatus Limnocylindria bacterium]|nr:hypothetical protein [Candidatus Limnocylindria bacterium]